MNNIENSSMNEINKRGEKELEPLISYLTYPIGLRVYEIQNEEYLYIKSVDDNTIWCGDNPNPQDELGWSFKANQLFVDLKDEETIIFLEDNGLI